MAGVLADPQAPERLFGVAVEVDGRRPRRWRAGSRFAVALTVAGEEARFAVAVARLDARGLAFRAEGPLVIEGEGDLVPAARRRRTRLALQAELSAEGLAGELAAVAAVAVLRGGALDRILAAVGSEAER